MAMELDSASMAKILHDQSSPWTSAVFNYRSTILPSIGFNPFSNNDVGLQDGIMFEEGIGALTYQQLNNSTVASAIGRTNSLDDSFNNVYALEIDAATIHDRPQHATLVSFPSKEWGKSWQVAGTEKQWTQSAEPSDHLSYCEKMSVTVGNDRNES